MAGKEFLDKKALVETMRDMPFTMSMCISVDECNVMNRARRILADAVESTPGLKVMREDLMAVLSRYFSIGDSYTYELTRDKSAFAINGVHLGDFEVWGEENVADLCDYIMAHLFEESGGEET